MEIFRGLQIPVYGVQIVVEKIGGFGQEKRTALSAACKTDLASSPREPCQEAALEEALDIYDEIIILGAKLAQEALDFSEGRYAFALFNKAFLPGFSAGDDHVIDRAVTLDDPARFFFHKPVDPGFGKIFPQHLQER